MSGTGGFIALIAKARGPFLENAKIATGRAAVKIKLAIALVVRAPHPRPPAFFSFFPIVLMQWFHVAILLSQGACQTSTRGQKVPLLERRSFDYVVSALFSCPQLETLRWAVIWIKKEMCLDRASSGVTALWEEQ